MPDAELDAIKLFFSSHGKVNQVRMKRDKHRNFTVCLFFTFLSSLMWWFGVERQRLRAMGCGMMWGKGTALVEFSTEEEAKSVLAAELVFGESTLRSTLKFVLSFPLLLSCLSASRRQKTERPKDKTFSTTPRRRRQRREVVIPRRRRERGNWSPVSSSATPESQPLKLIVTLSAFVLS